MELFKIYFIIGLSGSGKSSLIRNMINTYRSFESDLTLLIVDDFGSSLDRTCLKLMDEATTKYKRLIIASHLFCKDDNINKAIKHIKERYSDAIIEYIYFENDFFQACNNLFWREATREHLDELVKVNRKLSSSYNPPKNATTPVFRGDSADKVVSSFGLKIKGIEKEWDKVKNDKKEIEKFANYYGKLFSKLCSHTEVFKNE